MEEPRKSGGSSRIQTVIAWVVTAGLLAYIGLTTDFPEAMRAWDLADHVLLPLSIVGFTLVTYLIDTLTARHLLVRTGFPVRLPEFLRIKGASYLFNIVNYNLGLVLMAAVVTRRSGRGWRASGSPFLLLNFIDLATMAVLVFSGYLLAGSPLGPEATAGLLFVAAGGLLGAPVLCALSRWRAAPGRLGRLLGDDLLSAFRTLRAWELGMFVTLRGLLIGAYAAENWVFLLAFRFAIPFSSLMVLNPILGLVGVIPVSISGLGTLQVVMRDLFGPFAPVGLDPVASVDAFSTATIVGVLLVRVAIGLACLPSVWREVKSPRPADA